MLLSRLRIRGKLTLLVMIPLLAMAGLVLPVIRDLVGNANRADDINTTATVAGSVGALLQDLQRERLLSIGYLLGATTQDDLDLQTAEVTDRVRDVRLDLGDDLPDAVGAQIDDVAKLNALRQKVRARGVSPEQVLDQFAPLLDDMIGSLELTRHADAETANGQQLIALDAVLRLDESNTESTALLAMMSGGDAAGQADRYHEEKVEYDVYLDRFRDFATPSEQDLYALVAAAFGQRVGGGFDAAFDADPVKTMAGLPLDGLFPSLQSFSVIGGFVEKRIVDDVTSAVELQRQRQLGIAYGVGVLALLVFLAVLVLVAFVARSVAVPLTRLSNSAEQVARAGETELQRVADDDRETAEPVRLEVLDVNTNDEIGDLARAFERVRTTAAQLVERQVLSRRNVAEMFGHIGRRTQNLVGGQVTLIDELENEETNPDRLAKLYRLDHISNRLRRSADSLVVISGADREENHASPVRLNDAVRLALAEIEEYTRVDIDVPLDLLLAPALVSDLVLMCAELLENATTFSPPHTRVTVIGRAVEGGAELVIVDHGIGMPHERLTEEHARIGRRERLDLVPTQVLGLFVVGRLARRHGLAVALQHTPGGGVTVTVNIGDALLAGVRVAVAPASVEPIAIPAHRPIALEWSRAPGDVMPAFGGTDTGGVGIVSPRPDPEVLPGRSRAIARVEDAMRDPVPWNGFEVDRRLPAAPKRNEPAEFSPSQRDEAVGFRPPAQRQPLSSESLSSGPVASGSVGSGSVGSGPVADARPPAWQAPNPQPPGLNRRVPGAHLPAGTASPLPPQAPVLADAAAAQEFAEAFESGVRRAQSLAETAEPVTPVPVTPGPIVQRPVTQAPIVPAVGTASLGAPSLGRPGPGAASPVVARPDSVVVRQEAADAGSGTRPLHRRVPGATLPAASIAPRRSPLELTAVEHDPDEARSFVEQFELGVERALRFDDPSQ